MNAPLPLPDATTSIEPPVTLIDWAPVPLVMLATPPCPLTTRLPVLMVCPFCADRLAGPATVTTPSAPAVTSMVVELTVLFTPMTRPALADRFPELRKIEELMNRSFPALSVREAALGGPPAFTSEA